jgi:hypothetical protein
MRTPLFALGFLLTSAAPVFAGMPSVTLTDAASMRLQSISFFLVVFLLSALVIRWVWNSLAADFPRLPRLSYWKSLGLVGLWGLLFLLVLTMISGARELMTPGAWKRDGLTYTLGDQKSPEEPTGLPAPSEEARRNKLKSLFTSLAAYAVSHEGRYPAEDDAAIANHLWQTQHPSRMRFVYAPNRTTHDPGRVLACEPELFGPWRLVLFTNGDIRRMTSEQLVPLLAPEAKP